MWNRNESFFSFSKTFDYIQSDADRIWKFQRYSLVCEYLERPPLPPPLIIFSHGWRICANVCSRLCKSKKPTISEPQNQKNFSKILRISCFCIFTLCFRLGKQLETRYLRKIRNAEEKSSNQAYKDPARIQPNLEDKFIDDDQT